MVLAEPDLREARSAAERTRLRVGDETEATLSAGVTSLHGAEAVDDLLRRADQALCKDSEGGRKLVESAPLGAQEWSTSGSAAAAKRQMATGDPS